MTQRFYFPGNGTASAATVPAIPYGSQWLSMGGATRQGVLPTTKTDVASMGWDYALETLASVHNVLIRQYVSYLLAPQTISGTFSAVFAGVRFASAAQGSLQIVIRVVSYDGMTERGVLYAGHTDAVGVGQGLVYGVTAITRIFSAMDMTPVVAKAGDRMVVEVGWRAHNTVTAEQEIDLYIGATAINGDLPLTDAYSTSISTLSPWLEISGTLTPFVALVGAFGIPIG
jgi:hypothetical protein